MKKINIANILKNCPSGMELDCAMYEDIEFDSIINVDNDCFPIRCRIKNSDGGYNVYYFTKYGYWNNDRNAKCVIFPKGKTTWEGFVPPCQFKDGDIVSTRNGLWIGIVKEPVNQAYETYITINGESLMYDNPIFCFERFATDEEKAKLFQAIKDNGYKWNAETKTLEKLIEPKFKVGDKVETSDNLYGTVCECYFDENEKCYKYDVSFAFVDFGVYTESQLKLREFKIKPKFKVGDKIFNVLRKSMGALGTFQGTISEITDDKYIFTDGSYMFIGSQDNYELVPVEPKFKVGDRVKSKNCPNAGSFIIVGIKEDGYKINIKNCYIKFKDQDNYELQGNYELVPNKFDINTLKPFDKVLIRNVDRELWKPALWGFYINTYGIAGYYVNGGSKFEQCIPYEGNEHLLGTLNDCDEYFKTWK